MIEAYLCTTKYRDRTRNYFHNLTAFAFSSLDTDYHFLQEPMLERYYEAERRAKRPMYIFSDDDIIPEKEDSLQLLVQALSDYPQYAMIGLAWKKGLNCEEMGKWFYRKESDDLWEVDHVGGIMAIRKGVIEDLGEKCDYPNGIGDDKVICAGIRKSGYKVGLLAKERFHHLGECHSVAWKLQ